MQCSVIVFVQFLGKSSQTQKLIFKVDMECSLYDIKNDWEKTHFHFGIFLYLIFHSWYYSSETLFGMMTCTCVQKILKKKN